MSRRPTRGGLRSEAALRGYQLSSARAERSHRLRRFESLRRTSSWLRAEQLADLRELTTSSTAGVIALGEWHSRRADRRRRRPAWRPSIEADELGALFDLADRLSLGSSTAGATILVLDDDPSILTIVQFLLESEGVRIMTCDTPNELHQQLAAAAPSLL